MTPDGDGAGSASQASPSIPSGGLAVVIGATGGIGEALSAQLRVDPRFSRTLALSRSALAPDSIHLDLTLEASIKDAAATVAALHLPLRLVVVATGFLHGHGHQPEKALRQLDAAHLQHAFAVNVIGPALVMKHFLPLLAPQGKSVFAALSARVGSIGDNHLGGWYSYRTCKAALNQMLHTAAVELKRSRPDALCVLLHPGTVATRLSSPFAKTGLNVRPAREAATDLLTVLAGLNPADSGCLIDYQSQKLPF